MGLNKHEIPDNWFNDLPETTLTRNSRKVNLTFNLAKYTQQAFFAVSSIVEKGTRINLV